MRPRIDRELPLAEAREGFAAMADGDLVGKIVFSVQVTSRADGPAGRRPLG